MFANFISSLILRQWQIRKGKKASKIKKYAENNVK